MDNQVSTTALIVIAATGGVAGTLITVVAGWWNDRLQAKRAHAQWLRERRYEAYGELAATMHVLAAHIIDGSTGDDETIASLTRRYNDVKLLMSSKQWPEVEGAWRDFNTDTQTFSYEKNLQAIRRMLTALRADLHNE